MNSKIIGNTVDIQIDDFSKVILTGLFAGVVSGIFNIILFCSIGYETVYSKFSLLLNPGVLIYVSLILVTLCSMIFYLLRKTKNERFIYILLLGVATSLTICYLQFSHMTGSIGQIKDIRHAFTATTFFTGICATILIPYAYNHKKFFSNII